MTEFTPSTKQLEAEWWKLMQGDLVLDEDPALRSIIQRLTDYVRDQILDRDGNLIEIQLGVDGNELAEITSDEMARRIAEGLSLILYGGTVRGKGAGGTPPFDPKLKLKRMVRFTALCEHYGIALKTKNWNDSAEEDAAAIVAGDDPLYRWIAITRAGEFVYLKPCPTRQDAIDRTIENASDDIWAESPVAICDLDNDSEPWGRIYHLLSLSPVYEEES